MSFSPFYQFMASNTPIEMDVLQSLATQVKGGSELCWSGHYPQEQYKGIDFFWLKNSCSLFFQAADAPSVILFTVPKAIFSIDTLNHRLLHLTALGSNSEPVAFTIKADFEDVFVVEFNLPRGESLLTLTFSDYFQEENGGRTLSLPVKSIIKVEEQHYNQMNAQELNFALTTGGVAGQTNANAPDKIADYFIQLMGSSES
ncbi:hypothetical protein [Vibrio sp. 10N]|uniref:hypothetical protein n=1 Tax=Vibrio sp. 10N TaxID=3058938 RepID=UPI002812C47D|nr:hypothetical protein VB10N_28920 [Vibrio sp. 10N]